MHPSISHILTLIIFLSISVYGQGTQSDIIKSYKEKFKWHQYKIYAHLNKKVFVPGQQIYFTAYAIDQTELVPLKGRMNLDVGLYDGQGNMLKSSVWEMKNGIAYGSIETDRHYNQGKYYFKAGSKWNKNFSDQGNSILEIDLIENELANESGTDKNVRTRIIAEGGGFLNDRFNTLGFQIIDGNHRGVSIKRGQIEEANGGVVLSNITINSYGLGRVDLFLEKGKSYQYEFELIDGTIVRGVLPSGKDEGYSLNMSGPIDNTRIVTIQFGKKTFEERKNRRFYLMVHQGTWVKSIPFKMDKKKKSFRLNDNYLTPGVNIVSLLDREFNMLTKRVVFNYRGVKKADAQVFRERITGDSIYLAIRSDRLHDTEGSFSISILPDNSDLNQDRKTAFEVFYLEPYLDKFAKTSPTYYKSFDRKTLYNLDLLLMIHGKTDHKWERSIESFSPPTLPLESGFSIQGYVRNKAKNKKNSIAFFQDQIDKMKILEINEDSTFSIDNHPVYEDIPINFVLIDSKGKMKEPIVDFDIFPKKKIDSIDLSQRSETPEVFTKENQDNGDFIRAFEEQTNVLENVTVVAKAAETETTRNTVLNTGFWNAIKITDDIRLKNQVLSRYLRRAGFRVVNVSATNKIFVLPRSNSPQEYPPTIYVDGFEINEPLTDYLLHTIDEIYYEHVGLTESNGGSIYIYRKYDSRVADKSAPFLSLKADNGYKRPEPFISMINPDGINERINHYMSVHWEPDLHSKDESEIIFGFPRLGMKNFTLYIEGVTADGWIFSESVKIEDSDLKNNH